MFRDATFSADASMIGDEKLACSWSFGDGGTATGMKAVHQYSKPGKYDVVVVVTHEASGKSAQKTVTIEVVGVGAGPKK
jgi:PKD repeat protein